MQGKQSEKIRRVICFSTFVGLVSLQFQYLLLAGGGRRAVERDELLQVLFQAGLGSVPLGRLGAPEVGPELRLAAQQAVALVPPAGVGENSGEMISHRWCTTAGEHK